MLAWHGSKCPAGAARPDCCPRTIPASTTATTARDYGASLGHGGHENYVDNPAKNVNIVRDTTVNGDVVFRDKSRRRRPVPAG